MALQSLPNTTIPVRASRLVPTEQAIYKALQNFDGSYNQPDTQLASTISQATMQEMNNNIIQATEADSGANSIPTGADVIMEPTPSHRYVLAKLPESDSKQISILALPTLEEVRRIDIDQPYSQVLISEDGARIAAVMAAGGITVYGNGDEGTKHFGIEPQLQFERAEFYAGSDIVVAQAGSNLYIYDVTAPGLAPRVIANVCNVFRLSDSAFSTSHPAVGATAPDASAAAFPIVVRTHEIHTSSGGGINLATDTAFGADLVYEPARRECSQSARVVGISVPYPARGLLRFEDGSYRMLDMRRGVEEFPDSDIPRWKRIFTSGDLLTLIGCDVESRCELLHLPTGYRVEIARAGSGNIKANSRCDAWIQGGEEERVENIAIDSRGKYALVQRAGRADLWDLITLARRQIHQRTCLETRTGWITRSASGLFSAGYPMPRASSRSRLSALA